ncbi:hypothetical protein T459_17399 [Capsicum annuum]|uniref:Uncharacterized protein n=1 Tax=Capsicum annuum TaxID=4072 RepID=A0A2G2ZBG4_CAPAN|nr:hypothetical protein T459_17399 [Capsicum annuum]
MILFYSKDCSSDLIDHADVGYLSDPHKAWSQTDYVFICGADIGDSSTSSAMNHQELGAAFDPIDIVSSWNISQRQEAATRLAADSVAAKSGAGSIGDCTKTRVGSSSSSSFPPQNNYLPHFGNNQLGVFGLMTDHGSTGGLWNIHTNNAVSSGESAINAFKSKSIDANDNNNIQYSVNELDEAVSNTSSYHLRDNMDKRNHNALLESGENILN